MSKQPEKRVRRKAVSRSLTVKNTENLTKNMKRITVMGDDLASFPPDMVGGYIKLLFKQNDSDKPIMRTYTVAGQRSERNEIDIDFMMHGDHGVASSWANHVKVGDDLVISGGGPKQILNPDADWVLIAGDMTALPAMAHNLTQLPNDATGYAVIEILSEEDKYQIIKPEGVDVIWVINPDPGSDDTPLVTAIENIPWQEGDISAWIACEFTSMKKARDFLLTEKNIEKSQLYVSSYWKNGLNEEKHKVIKRDDNEKLEALFQPK